MTHLCSPFPGYGPRATQAAATLILPPQDRHPHFRQLVDAEASLRLRSELLCGKEKCKNFMNKEMFF